MTRSTPADILTYLTTNWDTDITTKPHWVDQFENEMMKDHHSIGINWVGMSWVEMTTGYASKDEETNTLSIMINETTLSDLNKVIDHVRDLLKVKTLAGGHYMIPMGSPMKEGNHYICFLTLNEVMSLK